MPRRTNAFQRLVYLLKQHAASGASVTESRMLVDRITGAEREVDVCVETSVAGHSLVIGIECRDHGRALAGNRSGHADVTWIEQMKCKHERLPTNALVLVSRRGFTAEATRLAAACGIETLALEEQDTNAVDRLLGNTGTIWKNFYQAQPTRVRVEILPLGSSELVVVRCHQTTQLLDAQSQDAGTMDNLVGGLLALTPIRAYFETHGKPEHRYFEFRWTLPSEPGLFLRKLKPARLERVALLHVIGTVRFDGATFQMRQARLGATSFLWAVGKAFGNDVVAVASDAPSGRLVSLSVIESGKKRESGKKASRRTVANARPRDRRSKNASRNGL